MSILKVAEKNRLIVHALLFVVTALSVGVTGWLLPRAEFARLVALGLGYVSLLFMAVTLLIGPWQLLVRRRRNPVHIYLRRDIGIWAGLTAIVHVIYALQLHFGGRILSFFFRPDSFVPLINPFGVSNYVGLAATLIALTLLLTSNDLSVRLLNGRRWKWLQRLNYLLFPAALLHTFGFQFILKRPLIMALAALAVALVVLLFQSKGYHYFRRRWRGRRRDELPTTTSRGAP